MKITTPFSFLFFVVVSLASASILPRDACSEPGGIQNLIRSGSNVYWDPPANIADCPVQYRVVYQDNFNSDTRIISTTQFSFSLISCAAIRISVTAIVGNVESEVTTSLAFEVPLVSDIPPPVSVGVIPGRNSAESYWRAAPQSEHACPITSILVIVRSGNGPSLQNVRVDVDENDSRLFRVQIENLNPNTEYQLFGVLYSNHTGSQMSSEASFTTTA